MASTTRNLVGGLVLSATFLAAEDAWSAERSLRIVVVHVENYAQVSPDTLAAAESEASNIYAAAYSRNPEFYSFYRSLQAYRNSLGREGDVLVLSPDSEFFRYLKSPAATPLRR